MEVAFMRSVTVGSDLIFVFERRAEGPAVHLLVRFPADPPHTETRQFRQVWRADCFRKKPHEHFFRPDGEKQVFLSGPFAHSPMNWANVRMAEVGAILREAGYPQILVDIDALVQHLPELSHHLEAVAR